MKSFFFKIKLDEEPNVLVKLSIKEEYNNFSNIQTFIDNVKKKTNTRLFLTSYYATDGLQSNELYTTQLGGLISSLYTEFFRDGFYYMFKKINEKKYSDVILNKFENEINCDIVLNDITLRITGATIYCQIKNKIIDYNKLDINLQEKILQDILMNNFKRQLKTK